MKARGGLKTRVRIPLGPPLRFRQGFARKISVPGGTGWKPPSRLLKKQITTALLFSTRRAAGPRADRTDGPLTSSAAYHRPRRARVAFSEPGAGRSYGLGGELSDPK